MPDSESLVFIGVMLLLTGYQIYKIATREPADPLPRVAAPAVENTEIIFTGIHKSLADVDFHAMLQKRFPYYSRLSVENQEKFLKRLLRFMKNKTFIIKDDEGFKEMPVLVSAAAIQLTFGLKDYLLPFYSYVRIYPEEYFADDSFKVLAGNVRGRTVTVAWNHFLQGFADCGDGCNVGLHEWSHALYFQKIEVERREPHNFHKQYADLMEKCKDAYGHEVSGRFDLYSDYAVKHMEEFWAESIELFFEKPKQLKYQYPELYNELVELLNQDPLNVSSPVLPDERSASTKVIDFLFR